MTKFITLFLVREKKEENRRVFVSSEPLELLKLTNHELVFFSDNKQYVLTSNYKITDFKTEFSDGNQLLLMFSYVKPGENYQKLYPLPLKNEDFSEGMAFERFKTLSSEEIKNQALESDEIKNLIVEFENLQEQIKSALEMAKNLTKKQTNLVQTIAPTSYQSYSTGSTNHAIKKPVKISNQNKKREPIQVLSHSSNNTKNTKRHTRQERKMQKEFSNWFK